LAWPGGRETWDRKASSARRAISGRPVDRVRWDHWERREATVSEDLRANQADKVPVEVQANPGNPVRMDSPDTLVTKASKACVERMASTVSQVSTAKTALLELWEKWDRLVSQESLA